jgi:hypothetical protein
MLSLNKLLDLDLMIIENACQTEFQPHRLTQREQGKPPQETGCAG